MLQFWQLSFNAFFFDVPSLANFWFVNYDGKCDFPLESPFSDVRLEDH